MNLCILYGSLKKVPSSQRIRVGETGFLWIRAVKAKGFTDPAELLDRAHPKEGEFVLNTVEYYETKPGSVL